MTIEYKEPSAEAERMSLPWLDGFWREEHNSLQPIPDHLYEGVRARAEQYLDRMSRVRWIVIEDWDQWRFEL